MYVCNFPRRQIWYVQKKVQANFIPFILNVNFDLNEVVCGFQPCLKSVLMFAPGTCSSVPSPSVTSNIHCYLLSSFIKRDENIGRHHNSCFIEDCNSCSCPVPFHCNLLTLYYTVHKSDVPDGKPPGRSSVRRAFYCGELVAINIVLCVSLPETFIKVAVAVIVPKAGTVVELYLEIM